jgi:hypothetical protein
MKSLTLLHLAQYADGSWTLRIGDPTFIGWFTTVCYFAVAYLCYRNARNLQSQKTQRNVAVFWWTITFVIVFFGFNKQLDLQILITDIGRRLAKSQGWYEYRRQLQRVFVIAIAVSGLTAITLIIWILRKRFQKLRIVFVGMAILFLFVVMRAGTFHHLDELIDYRLADLSFDWIFEISGLAVIGLGAFNQRR